MLHLDEQVDPGAEAGGHRVHQVAEHGHVDGRAGDDADGLHADQEVGDADRKVDQHSMRHISWKMLADRVYSEDWTVYKRARGQRKKEQERAIER